MSAQGTYRFYYFQRQTILLVNGEPLGRERVNLVFVFFISLTKGNGPLCLYFYRRISCVAVLCVHVILTILYDMILSSVRGRTENKLTDTNLLGHLKVI